MDCCNYGEYRAHGHSQYAGGAPGWDGYAPYGLPYAPYAHGYYAAHAHDPYARYSAYRYDYTQHHTPHIDHAVPMDYGPYSPKEMRVRRAVARRDARARSSVQHLPLPPTPPLECGMNGRGPGYCEPQMWHHYQMGVMNGGGAWASAAAGASSWASRGVSCSREQVRYQTDYRSMKVPHPHTPSMGYPDGRSTPFSMYDEHYEAEAASARQASYAQAQGAAASAAAAEAARASRERVQAEAKPSPPEEKRPPVVPLPAFQQAFGSTEIGKFAEAFSRTEIKLEEISAETFPYESFSDWDGPAEPQWSSQPCKREIKCEDNL